MRNRGAPSAPFRALHKTLANHTEAGAIVYLADWHFEDDQRPEGLLDRLKARKQTFSVVGSEAAFGRGWNDGFAWTGRGGVRRSHWQEPVEGAGRAPWHGGDTAYNHVPHRFGGPGWQTEFPIRMEGRENLLQRLRKGQLERPSMTALPLPSAFGPYALSRICQQTGGRYVLWSWNRAGRNNVTYDYALRTVRARIFAVARRSARTSPSARSPARWMAPGKNSQRRDRASSCCPVSPEASSPPSVANA